MTGFFMEYYLESWEVGTDLISLLPSVYFPPSFILDIMLWFICSFLLVPYIVLLWFSFTFNVTLPSFSNPLLGTLLPLLYCRLASMSYLSLYKYISILVYTYI